MIGEELIRKREERGRRAAHGMSASFMSNAKWRKALEALTGVHPGGVCDWKMLRIDEPIRGWLPHPGEVDETYLDCSLTHAHSFMYRDIEWLEIPAEIRWQRYPNAPISRRSLNLRLIRGAFEAVGEFELEESASALRIHGYRP